ncbi:MAG: hypothetical protein OEV43_07270 [Coriobacteriia bacterium]|nr:hypothetical protein [Coriobacteriia bacterium]
MDPIRPLAPCLVGSGTLTHPRDMIRALETLESLDYVYEVDGAVVAQGRATLVKLMADLESATMAVNGCLFLNVASFRYLDFATEDDGMCVMRLFGDGTVLTLVAEPENATMPKGQLRLLEEAPFDLESYVVEEEEDD